MAIISAQFFTILNRFMSTYGFEETGVGDVTKLEADQWAPDTQNRYIVMALCSYGPM